MSDTDKMVVDMVLELSKDSAERIEDFRRKCLEALVGADGNTIRFTNALCDVALKRHSSMEVA